LFLVLLRLPKRVLGRRLVESPSTRDLGQTLKKNRRVLKTAFFSTV
jgi:hypothetical protein